MKLFTPLRSLLRAPGMALSVAVTIAIGIGALVTAFVLVNAAVWRPAPFPGSDRIAMLYVTRTSPTEPFHRDRWSFPSVTLLKAQASSIATIANYSGISLTLRDGDAPEWIDGETVSPEYFGILGARAELGRTFDASEDAAGTSQPVVVLGYDLWRRRFGSDRSVIGRTVRLNTQTLTVIGVMPPGFRGLTDKAQLWVPTRMAPRLTYPEYLTSRQNFISAVGRLQPGVEWPRAQQAVEAIGARIEQALPTENPDSAEVVSATAVPLNDARIERTTRRSLLILFAAVAVLYLLACANATNLLLGRAAARRREAAILAAIGGTPARLVRHFLSEGLLLVAMGGSLGLLFAFWATQLLPAPTNVWGPRNFYGSLAAFAEPRMDLRAVGFAALLTALTMLLVAWAAAASAARVDINAGLRDGSRGASTRTGTLRQPTMRGVIVGVEVALAMLLLVGGALMIDSFMRMRRTNLGIDPERILTFWVRPPEAVVPVDRAPAFVSRILESISSVPGVIAATVDGGAPVAGTARSTLFIVGRPAPRREDAPPVLRHYIAPDHFRVLDVPLLQGRFFTAADNGNSPRVAIISESAAKRFWPNQDPLGQRVYFGGGSSFNHPDSSATIVGVVGDVVHEPLDIGPNPSSFYTPYPQFTYAARMVMIKTAGDPMALLPAVRQAVNRVDPDLPLVEVQTLTTLIGGSWARQRFDATLFGAFAAIAIILATSGIFAVVSYAVSQRKREMGIRMALGAQPSSILRLVIRDGMGFPVVGALAGLIAALLLGRLMQAVLYEVKPTDPVVLGGTAALLLAVSLLACFTPALRATREDPLDTLRSN